MATRTISNSGRVLRTNLCERPKSFELDHTHPLAQGLVFAGLGNLASAGGTMYSDSSLYGRDGVLTGYTAPAASWSRALGRSVLGFVGASSQYVNASACNQSWDAPDSFSLSAWVRMNGSGYGVLAQKYKQTPDTGWILYVGTNFYLLFVNGTSVSPTTKLTDGVLSHTVVTYDGAVARFYLNGRDNGSPALAKGSCTSVVTNASIGRSHLSAEYLTASVSDLCFFRNRILSPSEISQLADPSNVMLSGLIRESSPSARRVFQVPGLVETVRRKRVRSKLRERPDNFVIDHTHSLANGLVFAGLGNMAGSGGTHYHDSSLHENHGVLAGYPNSLASWSRELGRACLRFDGSDDIVRSVYKPILTIPFTLASWVNHSSIGWSTLFHLYIGGGWSSGAGWFALNGTTAGRFFVGLTTTSYSFNFTNPSRNLGAWYFLAASYDGIKFTVWQNNTSTSEVGGVGALVAQAQMSLGNPDNLEYPLRGLMADSLVWNRILSPDEIQQLADPSNIMLSGLIRETPTDRRIFYIPSPSVLTYKPYWRSRWRYIYD